MSVVTVIEEALRIARAHKSLWLFGLIAGFTLPNVNFGGGGGGQPPAIPGAAGSPPGIVALLVLVGLAVVIGLVILRFVSTGALIEGVKRAHTNGSMTVREGFREGWAHWGVLLRVALLFLVANGGSMVLIFGACYLVARAIGDSGFFIAGAIALLIAAPWLVTLYMWQAFAERIAVLENRTALDAIRKARLFLHGRLPQGLKLVVASFLSVLLVAALAIAVIAPVVLLVRAAFGAGALPAIGLVMLTVLPTVLIAVALLGVMTSSVWTIGYLKQVER
jgi:hypothetical protein